MTAPATGQIWRRKNSLNRRIRLLNEVRIGDWKYETIPAPYERRRTGHIYEHNLTARYIPEEES